jgi:hypothetical protein
MRAARLFLGVSASVAVIASVASGCGSSSSNPPVDSGTGEDVTMEAAPMEAAVEAAAEAAAPEAAVDAACVPDASLSSIVIPDAGIADSGINVAACLGCIQTETNCAPIVTACSTSCVCVSAVEGFANCLEQPGASAAGCLLSNLATASIPGVTMGEEEACGITCASTCGVNLGGGDSGSMQDSATTSDGPTE